MESVLQKMDSEGTIQKMYNFQKEILENEIVYMISSKIRSTQENAQQRSHFRAKKLTQNQSRHIQKKLHQN